VGLIDGDGDGDEEEGLETSKTREFEVKTAGTK